MVAKVYSAGKTTYGTGQPKTLYNMGKMSGQGTGSSVKRTHGLDTGTRREGDPKGAPANKGK